MNFNYYSNAMGDICQMKNETNYYLGLDIGTDSVGYAVTDEQYNLLRLHGDAAWGSMVFDAGDLSAARRGFRSVRRRLNRRKQRVTLLQEIFAREIAKVDERFYIRLSESYLWRENTNDKYIFFDDENYTDVQYMAEYPTIHHLICDLIENPDKHDVRLVYMACAWLVVHRGHFLSNIKVDNISELVDIKNVYGKVLDYFKYSECICPWKEIDIEVLGKILSENVGINDKYKNLSKLLLNEKPEKKAREDFPYSEDGILRLLAGGTCKLKDIFCKEEYDEFGSVALGMDDKKMAEIMSSIGDDFELIKTLRGLYDWSLLANLLNDESNSPLVSKSKVHVYEQHKKDLKDLKYIVRKYIPQKYYEIFRAVKDDNYAAYSDHYDLKNGKKIKKKADIEKFSEYILKVLKTIEIEDMDKVIYDEIIERLELRTFMPKQKNTDNRVIPHQLYEYELKKILKNAENYLPFLKETDVDGMSNTDKIMSIFRFKIPYFVGPLNASSSFSWIVREAGKITPWNFDKKVDFDASEQAFIKRMTNHCTYLPQESVLPKDSLCYQRFMVLNEVNNIKIDGQKIPVNVKQEIYKEIFENRKKVRKKDIIDYLLANGYLMIGEEDKVSGLDDKILPGLSSFHDFKRMMKNNVLSETDVEDIIERAAYAEDKSRITRYLSKNYNFLPEEDIRYICKIKVKDFGRLSREFLTCFEGMNKATGEIATVLQFMWNTNCNLMELLSDKYSFVERIKENREEYYSGRQRTLDERLDEMYISNSVRRSIYRTLAIVKDVTKAFGVPKKIYVEMTRSSNPQLKGKKTKTRQRQIIELYEKCKEEDVRDLKHQLELLGECVDSRLQGDRLFLYFMQFGKSAYSGETIELEKLMAGSKEYDIDHIYPQAYVKDDSIINNKVLVLSKENGAKKDCYPVPTVFRKRMCAIWKFWYDLGALSDEKYKRLIRSVPFTDDEKYGFINRQLTETSQSTKAIAQILDEKYPDAEIVYVKAGLVSDFRHIFDICKCRCYNDLHHAVDAYLNIVVGNVYHMKFSKNWFSINSSYSLKMKTIFKHSLICGGKTIWDEEKMLPKVIKTAKKNNAHFTKYQFMKTGGLFDQQPVKKAAGLIPRKAGMETEKYGGYNKASIMFFLPMKYQIRKKTDIIILSIESLYGKKFMQDEKFAKEYAIDRLQRIIGKRADEVSFPLGMKPWKINTMLSLDGFRVCITGISSKGKSLVAQPVMQLSLEYPWVKYLKKIEKYVEKSKNNPNYIYDEQYDIVSLDKNIELYDIFIDKLQDSIYKKRNNSPENIIVAGRGKFLKLSILEQCQVLENIQCVFGRMTGGCNLENIGGGKHTASTKGFSAIISNWKKNYQSVRIINQSPSGLWERRSQNLLELL